MFHLDHGNVIPINALSSCSKDYRVIEIDSPAAPVLDSYIQVVPELSTDVPKLCIQLFEHLSAFQPGSASWPAKRLELPHGRRTQALLAILAMASPDLVHRTELAELLWSQRGRLQAGASLRQSIYALVRFLGAIDPSLLRVERTHLSLNTALISIDVAQLEASSGPRPQGLSVYRGTLLENLIGLDPAFDRWRAKHFARLTKMARDRADDALAIAINDLGLSRRHSRSGAVSKDAGPVVAAAERLLQIDPAHETAWHALIQAHINRRDRAAAVATFERCQHAMAKTARLSPSVETVDLVDSIRASPISDLFPAKTITTSSEIRRRIEGSRLCIGVMPFRHLGSTKQDWLSLGLTEEITAALARISWLTCIAPAGAAPAEAAGLSAFARSAEAGVESLLDFELEGTVQRSGEQVRITARLLDMHAGREIVWARRFDREGADTLPLQDEITAGIVAQLEPELLMLEGGRAQKRAHRRKSATSIVEPGGHSVGDDIATNESLLRAIPSIYRLEAGAFGAAGELLADAVATEPNSAAAHAWFGYWHLFQVGQGWSFDPKNDTKLGGDLAQRAVALDVGNARALTIAGHICGFLRRQPEEALALHDRALSLNPHLALAWCFSGLSLSYLGRHQEAIFRADTARRLAPLDPHAFFFEMAAGMPYLLLGQYERTVENSMRSLALNTAFSSTYKGLLSALGHLGRIGDAEHIRERLLVLEPGFTVAAAIARSPMQVAADLEHYAEGLRRGGLA